MNTLDYIMVIPVYCAILVVVVFAGFFLYTVIKEGAFKLVLAVLLLVWFISAAAYFSARGIGPAEALTLQGTPTTDGSN